MAEPSSDSPTPVSLSVRDWVSALRLWRLWTTLGFEDLSERYRRTLFGISWVVTSFAVFVGVKILVFGQMVNVPLAEFALFVTLGFGLWTFISTVVVDCCVAYTHSANWVLGSNIPYPVFFLQIIFRNWVVFALILLVMLATLAWQRSGWSASMLSAIPGLLVYVVTPVWLAALLAPLCARYRDVFHAVQTLMRLLFFATPIIWMPGQNLLLDRIAHYNLLTHFIEIVREPLIYDTVPLDSWAIVLVVNGIGMVAGFASYTATRNRIAFWL